MRRTDYQETDERVLIEILNAAEFGHLGLAVADGYPRVVPLNFVYLDGAVQFHGALDGEKFAASVGGPGVTFSVEIAYCRIPSYWVARDYACPATTLYHAALLRGRIQVVDDLDAKCRMLTALMEKYQPEGGYKPITSEDPLYFKSLRETAVFRIETEFASIKAKFGQNRSEKVRREIARNLEERNQGRDREAARLILATLGE